MIQSSRLAAILGLKHGFGEATDLGAAGEFWPGPRPSWKQVHGTRVADVKTPSQTVGEADGLRTRLGEVPIGIVTADCVPILLARRDGSEIAALHAGWRGTLDEIVSEFVRAAGRPKDWVAVIGPCAGPCCYEVSEELAADFARRFGDEGVPRARHLDLPAANARLFCDAGFEPPEILRHCTICERTAADEFRFHSYRRDQTTLRQRSQIQRGNSPRDFELPDGI